MSEEKRYRAADNGDLFVEFIRRRNGRRAPPPLKERFDFQASPRYLWDVVTQVASHEQESFMVLLQFSCSQNARVVLV